MKAEEMFKNYTKMKQEMTVLEFKIRDFEGIRKEDVIESMNFSKPQGDRVQEGMVSDKTGRAAAYYRRVADRLDDEYFDELFRRYLYLKDEIDFFGFLTTQLSDRLPEFVRDMVMEQMDWNGLMEKYSISYSTVGRYRKKAAREMDQMYEFRDDVEMKYILS